MMLMLEAAEAGSLEEFRAALESTLPGAQLPGTLSACSSIESVHSTIRMDE
jgi:hypothetical protein